jgi:hypothetical protein
VPPWHVAGQLYFLLLLTALGLSTSSIRINLNLLKQHRVHMCTGMAFSAPHNLKEVAFTAVMEKF